MDTRLKSLSDTVDTLEGPVRLAFKEFNNFLAIYSENMCRAKNKALTIFGNDPSVENMNAYRQAMEEEIAGRAKLEELRENLKATQAARHNAWIAYDALNRFLKSAADVKSVGLQPDMLLNPIEPRLSGYA